MGLQSSKLNGDDLDYILRKTRPDVYVILKSDIDRKYKQFRAKFGKEISQKYLVRLYDRYFPNRNNKEIYEMFLKKYSADSNYVIGFKSFIMAVYTAFSPGSIKDELAFCLYDVNCEGYIRYQGLNEIGLGHYRGEDEQFAVAKADMFATTVLELLGTDASRRVSIEKFQDMIEIKRDTQGVPRLLTSTSFLDECDLALLALNNEIHHSVGYGRRGLAMNKLILEHAAQYYDKPEGYVAGITVEEVLARDSEKEKRCCNIQ